MKPTWVAWRMGYLGVWSIAHLTTNGTTSLCGEPLPVAHRRAGKYLTKCKRCSLEKGLHIDRIVNKA